MKKKQTSVKHQGMVPGRWFALLRRPDALPVLFSSAADAIQNQDDDEYLVEVVVRPASTLVLLSGELEMAERGQQERPRRPRLPATEKVRRGKRRAAAARVRR